MADIAQLGFAVDTGDLKDAKASLDALVPAASKAEGAAKKVEAAMNGAASGADRAASGAGRAGAAMNGAASGANVEAGALNNAAAAVNRKTTATGQLIERLRGVPAAANQAAAGVRNVGQAVNDNAGAMKANVGNIAAQFQDIGVTAAGGMSPLMIALQQGTQLSAVFAQTSGGAMRALGGAIAQVLNPTSLLTIGIIGLIAAGIQMVNWMNVAKTALNAVASGMDYLASVASTLVPILIVVGATMLIAFGPQILSAILGVATAIGGFLVSAISGATTALIGFALANPFTALIIGVAALGAAIAYFSGATISDLRSTINFIIAGFVGAFNAIKRTWSMLPAAIGDAAIQAVNRALVAINGLISRSVAGINSLIDSIPEPLRPGGRVGTPALGMLANPYSGAQARVAGIAAEEAGRAHGRDYVGGFVRSARGLLTRGARAIRGFAAGLGAPKPKKERGGGDGADRASRGQSDAEKFADIVSGARRDIAEQEARRAAAALDLTAEASARLEYQTRLLNQAQQKGITLTAAQRTQIDELAGAYAAAKVAADNAVGLRDVLRTADNDITNLRSQAELVGLYGRNLAFAAQMQKLLNDAKQKGMTPDAIAAARPQFEQRANQYADASVALEHNQFMEDQRRRMLERIATLTLERDTIGLNADETNRLRIENELLLQARQKNINLTPADIAAIQGIAREQSAAENAIRRTREALDFAKEATKGFFNDLRNNLQQGKTIWESFGNAVLGVLNRIIDRLMNNLLDSMVDNLFLAMKANGGGGGIGGFIKGIFNAKGNAFGANGITAFASGGAFTNTVVKSPTAFAFGTGKLGIMGEAGDEAIMPLQRGPDGSLGVQMFGGGGGQPIINAPVNIKNDNRVTGAVSSQDIVDMQRRASEQTKRDLARQLPAIISQYQRDGTMV